LLSNAFDERRRPDYFHSRSKPEYPTPERPVIRDIERHRQAAIGTFGDLLRVVPDAAAQVRRKARVEFEFDVLRLGPEDAHGRAEEIGGELASLAEGLL